MRRGHENVAGRKKQSALSRDSVNDARGFSSWARAAAGGRPRRVRRVRGRGLDGGQTGVRRPLRRGSDGFKWLVSNGSGQFKAMGFAFLNFFSTAEHSEWSGTTGNGTDPAPNGPQVPNKLKRLRGKCGKSGSLGQTQMSKAQMTKECQMPKLRCQRTKYRAPLRLH